MFGVSHGSVIITMSGSVVSMVWSNGPFFLVIDCALMFRKRSGLRWKQGFGLENFGDEYSGGINFTSVVGEGHSRA